MKRTNFLATPGALIAAPLAVSAALGRGPGGRTRIYENPNYNHRRRPNTCVRCGGPTKTYHGIDWGRRAKTTVLMERCEHCDTIYVDDAWESPK